MGVGVAGGNSLLKLLLWGTTWAGLARNDAAPLTSLYLALHSADPAGGTQSTSEVAYTGYARVAVARSSAGLAISGDVASLAGAALFPACTGGSATAAYVSLGTLASGAGVVIASGPVTENIAIANTVVPQLTTATALTLS